MDGLADIQKQVGIWIRASTEDQSLGESSGRREHRARHYAEAKDWPVGKVYPLEGVRGKNVAAHPQAKQILKGVADGATKGLIFILGSLASPRTPSAYWGLRAVSKSKA